MFRYFETQIDPTARPPEAEPPATLRGFYWHYIRQAKGLFAALFALGFVLAVIEALIPFLIGRLVSILSRTPAEEVLSAAGPALLAMAGIVLLARPLGTILFRLIVQPFARSLVHEHGALAKLLARGAPAHRLLQRGFRRPHRQPGAADPRGHCARAFSPSPARYGRS